MAMPQVTEDDYKAYGATRPWTTVAESLPVAVRMVRSFIGPNVPEDDDEIEAYKRAVIAASLVDISYGQSSGIGEGVTSLHIGSFTVASSASSSGSSYLADMAFAIRLELQGSGLMYGGVALGGDC